MSSATQVNMAASRQMMNQATDDQAVNEGVDLGLSPRQIRLNRLWSHYRCENYDSRAIDWNGGRNVAPEEKEFIAASGYTPPGFTDGTNVGVDYRRPSTPFYLARVIVDRFTGLLFSQRRHPKISVPDDPKTEDWVNAIVEQCRLWAMMTQARTFGGGTGSVAIGFKFVNGKCQVEVHDPRFCNPEFIDRSTQELLQIEKRYMYEDDIRDNTGKWVRGKFWYRRVIDPQKDTVWPKVPVRPGEEPDWSNFRHSEVVHGFNFCPVVWVQNKALDGEVDGDSDCHGAYDLIEKCDQLRSQAHRATMANCDPTLNINTDSDIGQVTTGSKEAIKLEKGGSAAYLEIDGSGPKSAREQADELEEKALILVRCMLDTNEGGPSRTESEVEHNYSSMIEQADVLREQYGEKGVKRLITLIVRAARSIEKPRADRTGDVVKLVRQKIVLPPKVETDEDGKIKDKTEREVGSGEILELTWPPYFQPTLKEIAQGVDAAGKAKTFGLVDDEYAVRFIAPFFQIEDVKGLLKKLQKSKDEADAKMEKQMMDRMKQAGPKPGAGAGGGGLLPGQDGSLDEQQGQPKPKQGGAVLQMGAKKAFAGGK